MVRMVLPVIPSLSASEGGGALIFFAQLFAAAAPRSSRTGPYVEIEAEGLRLDPDMVKCVERSAQVDVAAKDEFLGFEERFHFRGGAGKGAVADRLASHRRSPESECLAEFSVTRGRENNPFDTVFLPSYWRIGSEPIAGVTCDGQEIPIQAKIRGADRTAAFCGRYQICLGFGTERQFNMRKSIVSPSAVAAPPISEVWRDLERIARVEISSEDASFPLNRHWARRRQRDGAPRRRGRS